MWAQINHDIMALMGFESQTSNNYPLTMASMNPTLVLAHQNNKVIRFCGTITYIVRFTYKIGQIRSISCQMHATVKTK